MTQDRKDFVCRRCGKCCTDLGCSFWTNSRHELIAAIDKRLPFDFYTDVGRCDMLEISEGGRATCLLQKWLGHSSKPDACRQYPFDGDPCDNEKAGLKSPLFVEKEK